ncbi:MAG: GerW family sporulation protein [Christensenellales bacterium]
MSNKKNNEQDSLDNLDKIINNTFEKLKDIVDANTTIGSVIKLSDKIFVVPVSKVSVGLVSGGGEFPASKKNSGLNAGSTTGFAITPIGFIAVNEQNIDYISASQTECATNKLLDTLINLTDKFLMTQQGEDNEKI